MSSANATNNCNKQDQRKEDSFSTRKASALSVTLSHVMITFTAGDVERSESPSHGQIEFVWNGTGTQ